MEVSETGDNTTGRFGKMIKGMGESDGSVASAKNIIVAMQHTNPKGKVNFYPWMHFATYRCKIKKNCYRPCCSGNNLMGFYMERAPGVSGGTNKTENCWKPL